MGLFTKTSGQGWHFDKKTGTLTIDGDLGDVFSPFEKLKKSVRAVKALKGARVRRGPGLFYGMCNLETANLTNLDVSDCAYMNDMFHGCSSLATLDLSTWDLRNVRWIPHMFGDCESLEEIRTGPLWKLTRVESTSCLFFNCRKLKRLEMDWSSSCLKDCCMMFCFCEAIEELDLRSLDVRNVKDISIMFGNCSNLRTLNLSGWNTSRMTTMKRVFEDCRSLQTLDLTGWHIGPETDTTDMFKGISGTVRVLADDPAVSALLPEGLRPVVRPAEQKPAAQESVAAPKKEEPKKEEASRKTDAAKPAAAPKKEEPKKEEASRKTDAVKPAAAPKKEEPKKEETPRKPAAPAPKPEKTFDQNESVRVVIADDAVFMRQMLKDILTKAGFDVVGEAADGNEAVELYRALKPDIVTLDITMPNLDGIGALRQIMAANPEAVCIMFSAMGQQSMVSAALQNGARDFIVKPFKADTVKETVLKYAKKARINTTEKKEQAPVKKPEKPSDQNEGRRILIADDSAVMRRMLKEVLTKAGLDVVGEAADGNEAVEQYRALKPDIVTLDVTMPNLDGVGALRQIMAADPEAVCIMCAAAGEKAKVEDALQNGARDYIAKPLMEDTVKETVLKYAKNAQTNTTEKKKEETPMTSGLIVITDPLGMHVRPAAMLVRLVRSFDCKCTFRYYVKEIDCYNEIDCGSLTLLMAAGIKCGSVLELKCEGPDAEKAFAEISEFLESNIADRYRGGTI